VLVASAPGRVNLIGEHTDYNQGLALPFAIGQHVTVSARALERPWIEVAALDLGEADSFPLDDPTPAPGWRGFVRGAVGELARTGVEPRGAEIEITGTLPRGGGLGSSAALEVALVLALGGLAQGDGGGQPNPQSEAERVALAKVCSRIENQWVGARSGLLDQLASLLGRKDHALQIDFRSLEVTYVPFELGRWRLVILDSGQRRANSASGYNQRRAECARACQLLGLDSLRQATPGQAERLPAPLDRRVRHILGANARVRHAVRALEHRDLKALGRLLDEGHASLRDLYDVSTLQVEAAVSRLKSAGAVGARLMGGGFGGHVLGLMPPGAAPPQDALEVWPGPGARVVAQ
jgi:galactokinase